MFMRAEEKDLNEAGIRSFSSSFTDISTCGVV